MKKSAVRWTSVDSERKVGQWLLHLESCWGPKRAGGPGSEGYQGLGGNEPNNAFLFLTFAERTSPQSLFTLKKQSHLFDVGGI